MLIRFVALVALAMVPASADFCCYFDGCLSPRDDCSPETNSCSKSVAACTACGGTLCPPMVPTPPPPPTPSVPTPSPPPPTPSVPTPSPPPPTPSVPTPSPPPPTPSAPTPPTPAPLMPARPLGHYLLLADDGTKYSSLRNWQPMLHPYQQRGSNLLYFFTINASYMPNLPPAFINLAKTRGTGKPGSVPKGTTIIAALGGETYSQPLNEWKFLTGSASDARAMGGKIAEWKKHGIDGIDLDIEQGIGDEDVGANIVEMIKGIKAKEPSFIITNPKDGYPSCKATNYLVNHAWNNQSKSLGVLDRVSIMYYTCQESLNYVKNYAAKTKPYIGYPIQVPVPTQNIIVGIGGADNANCITGLAGEVKSRNLGGMMVWFSSVIDNATNKTAISYTNQYDSAVAKASTWADALKILN